MNTTEEFHDETLQLLDQLVTSVLEAKEAFLARRYEDAAGYTSSAYSELKRVDARLNEMWE